LSNQSKAGSSAPGENFLGLPLIRLHAIFFPVVVMHGRCTMSVQTLFISIEHVLEEVDTLCEVLHLRDNTYLQRGGRVYIPIYPPCLDDNAFEHQIKRGIKTICARKGLSEPRIRRSYDTKNLPCSYGVYATFPSDLSLLLHNIQENLATSSVPYRG